MKVISIVNYKGGVGKTTLTANLGAQLAKLGYKTLLIDTDPQSNLTLSFLDGKVYKEKYLYTHTIRNLFATYIDHNKITPLENLIITPETINKKVNNHLDLLCSHIELFDIMNELLTSKPKKRKNHLTQIGIQSILRQALKKLKTSYDYVLIDCSPNFNYITQNAIIASDHYVIPVKLDFLSTDGLLQLNRLIENLTTKYNGCSSRDRFSRYDKINPKLLGIIPNMVKIWNELPTSKQQTYLNRILKDVPVFNTSLRVNSNFYDAPESLLPIIMHKGPVSVHEDLTAITDELLEKVGKTCKMSI